MTQLSITTIKDLCRPIGRPDFAYDFPLETCKLNVDDLQPLIGQEVYVSHSAGGTKMKITDISSKKIYGTAEYMRKPVDVDIDDVKCIEWSEKIVKRVCVRKGAMQR